MTGSAKDKSAGDGPISYQESKERARDPDMAVRRDLAERQDMRPEVLYFLTNDEMPEVRRALARNPKVPPQADLILARDSNENVRAELARKVAALTPDFDPESRQQATRFVIETLELLARDKAARVRLAVAEGLKSLTNAPPEIVRQLAQDVEDDIACLVLEASPLLDDDFILELIAQGCASRRLKSISRRPGLGAEIADSLVATDDVDAVTSLLKNDSAQIREETLDGLIEKAPKNRSWQRPLVERPLLSLNGIRKLAAFVSESLLDCLRQRPELDDETAEMIAELVESRFGGEGEEGECQAAQRASELHAAGELNQEILSDAVSSGDHDLVRHGIAKLMDASVELVEKVLANRAPKAITALVWRAGLSMRFSVLLQKHLAHIPPDKILYARDGIHFPLTEEEMAWQADFFESMAADGDSGRPDAFPG